MLQISLIYDSDQIYDYDQMNIYILSHYVTFFEQFNDFLHI